MSSILCVYKSYIIDMCYVGRKYWYQPVWLNTDLQAINVTIKSIVLMDSYNHEYLIYNAFRQKSEIFDSGSGFSIKYFGIWYHMSAKRLFLSELLEGIILRALSCIIQRIRLVHWLYAKIQEYYNSLMVLFTNPSARAGCDTRSIFLSGV